MILFNILKQLNKKPQKGLFNTNFFKFSQLALPATRTNFEKQNFFIQQLFTGCIAESAYYVESNNEVAIIDPLRDVQNYLDLAKERKSQIKYILLTHFHADFVSGHLDLQRQTGAKIIYGPNAQANFDLYNAKDQEELPLGKIKIKVLHTPGHTMESSTYMVVDNNNPYCIFTGDTLFLGEVGRPDLAVKKKDLTSEDLASHLYTSLQNKILNLPDDVLVFPGHGAGSPCGKAIQSGTHDTLGNQKRTNYALQIRSREEFIKQLCTGLNKPPAYFFHDVASNQGIIKPLEEVVNQNNNALSPDEAEKLIKQGYLVLDTRSKHIFLEGYLPNTVNIDISLNFALWVGTLITPDKKFILICDKGREKEIITRLGRIAYDNVAGYLDGGVEAWKKSGKSLKKSALINIDEFKKLYEKNKNNLQIIDVRGIAEKVDGYLEESLYIPLSELQDTLTNKPELLKKDKEVYVLCRSGARASIAISILDNLGFKHLLNVEGGMQNVLKNGIQAKFDECPSKKKQQQ